MMMMKDVACCAGLIAAAAAAAQACPPEAPSGRSTENEQVVEVTLSGDDIRVIRNGKPVPADRIRRDGDRISVLDEQGEATYEIAVDPDAESGRWEVEAVSFTQPAEQPPVMVGITMTEPDEALRAHLGLGDRKVIMLGDVLEGLPAAEAGLKKYDIIVAIDGSDDDVTPEHLHEVLMGKKPGDDLKLRVVRGSTKETYTVKLRAYEEGALAQRPVLQEFMEFTPTPPRAPASPSPAPMGNDRIEQLLGQLRGYGLSEQQLDSVRKALRQAMNDAREVEILRGPEGGFIFQGPDGQRQMFEFSPRRLTPGFQTFEKQIERIAPDRDTLERRLSQLEKRLDEMTGQIDERLERVLKRVEELTDRLERRLRDGD